MGSESPREHAMIEPKIGLRLKQLREAHSLSQNDMAAILGLKDRQSVSMIESGQRKVAALELVKAATRFGITLDELANPFLLSSAKANFSWRQHNVALADLNAFEAKAGEWIGAYRQLKGIGGKPLRALLPRLGLTYQSSFEDAIEVGEAVAAELKLELIPAKKLAEAVEQKLGVVVLMVDAIEGVSGAACRLPEMNAILINRHETAARRNFDLAHELFHILTWDTMPPERIDGVVQEGQSARKAAHQSRVERIERLADAFASGLLMPATALDALGKPHGELVAWLEAGAFTLGVSSSALAWRLHNAKRIDVTPKWIRATDLTKGARDRGKETPPAKFGRQMVETVVQGILGGHISARRAAGLLDMTTDELGELCLELGLDRPVEL